MCFVHLSRFVSHGSRSLFHDDVNIKGTTKAPHGALPIPPPVMAPHGALPIPPPVMAPHGALPIMVPHGALPPPPPPPPPPTVVRQRPIYVLPSITGTMIGGCLWDDIKPTKLSQDEFSMIQKAFTQPKKSFYAAAKSKPKTKVSEKSAMVYYILNAKHKVKTMQLQQIVNLCTSQILSGVKNLALVPNPQDGEPDKFYADIIELYGSSQAKTIFCLEKMLFEKENPFFLVQELEEEYKLIVRYLETFKDVISLLWGLFLQLGNKGVPKLLESIKQIHGNSHLKKFLKTELTEITPVKSTKLSEKASQLMANAVKFSNHALVDQINRIQKSVQSLESYYGGYTIQEILETFALVQSSSISSASPTSKVQDECQQGRANIVVENKEDMETFETQADEAVEERDAPQDTEETLCAEFEHELLESSIEKPLLDCVVSDAILVLDQPSFKLDLELTELEMDLSPSWELGLDNSVDTIEESAVEIMKVEVKFYSVAAWMNQHQTHLDWRIIMFEIKIIYLVSCLYLSSSIWLYYAFLFGFFLIVLYCKFFICHVFALYITLLFLLDKWHSGRETRQLLGSRQHYSIMDLVGNL
jgi:hypothetical protein